MNQISGSYPNPKPKPVRKPRTQEAHDLERYGVRWAADYQRTDPHSLRSRAMKVVD